MIQRYGLFGAYDDWKMEPDSDGEFVLFSDHVADVERLKPRVKALAWFAMPNGDLVNGEYTIMFKNRLYRNTDLYKGTTYRSLKAAKAAAQADYEARILAALAHPIADEERVAQKEGE